MTFLHKLAKRLALIPAVLACTVSLLSSCGDGTAHEYLGPDPTKPNPSGAYIGLSITPHDPQLVQGDSVRLEARGWLSSGLSMPASVIWSGGAVTSSGWFRATSVGSFLVQAVSTTNPSLADSVLITVIPPGGIARLDITPESVPLAAGSKQQFTAVALMGDGSRMFPTVSWTATGGTISPSGLFTAAVTPGGYTVTAIIGDGAILGRTAGIVDPPVLTGLALGPQGVMMESGAVRQFMAAAAWSDGSYTVPPISWSATGGAVTSAGVYTAGDIPGTYRVIASSELHGKADTSDVTILPRIVGIRVAPLTALLTLGATQVVKAEALRSDGTEGPVAVQWSAQGGSISLNGTYAAGTTPGNYAVVGTLTALGGQVFSDTAHFQVSAGAATLVQLFVRSDTSVTAGTTAQFSVAGVWSDGSSAVPAVTWSATGGSIDPAGLYTAGSAPGTFKVIATQQNGGKADTASVTVTPAPILTISAFTISPQSDIIGAGQSRQFSATLSWSDGQVHASEISWVSAGGTITQNGLYTAGTLAGSFLVIATCGCGAADTAAVTIPAGTAPPITLSLLVMAPPSVDLDPGGSQIFVLSGVWSDGATSPPPVSFIATGGSITSAGVYTAADVSGTYHVIATQVGGGRADTSVVQIRDRSAVLTQLVLNPSAVTVPRGATQPFVVSASWSDGSSWVPPVTFTATGGSVSEDGVYTAGATPGTYPLIVTHTGGTKADTSVITIPAAVTLNQLVLNPSTVSLALAGTQQFVVSGSWSDGSSVAPAVTWTVGGGSITAAGLYTAGSVAGTYQVIALHTGGTKADTSAVTITAAPPPPPIGSSGDLVVFPNEAVGFIIGPQVRAGTASNPWPWFDENMIAKGLQHGAAFPVDASVPADQETAGLAHYYDLGLTLYTAYYRTGNTTFLTYARKVADSWWLSPNIGQGTTSNNSNPQAFTPRNAGLGALMLRAMDGRPEMWPWITAYVREHLWLWIERQMDSPVLYEGVRDGGYMLTYAAWLAKAHPHAAVRAEFRQKALAVATQYYARLQHADGGLYWEFEAQYVPQGGDLYGSQPFMVGLLLEGLIAAHQLTGDPGVAQTITRATEWLYNKAFERQLVTNLTGVRWRAMKYFVYRTNPTVNDYTTAELYGTPDGAIYENRQLNSTTVHAFGYAYKLTGDSKFLQWGDDIFSANFGNGRGPGADAYRNLADYRPKEFNQNYRAAGRYLAWRLGH